MQRRPERWTGPPRRLVSPRRSTSPNNTAARIRAGSRFSSSASPSQVERRPSEPPASSTAQLLIDNHQQDHTQRSQTEASTTSSSTTSSSTSVSIQIPSTSPSKAKTRLSGVLSTSSPRADAQLGSYPPDCGSEHYKYLSLAKAKRECALTHAMRFSMTELDAGGNPAPESYPLLSTDFGAHNFQALPTDSAVLDQFGVGVALYFKFLKVMSWLFLLLVALSAPALTVYVVGGGHGGGFRSPWQEVQALVKQDPTALLGLTSLGHLREASSVCDQAAAGATLTISCPTGEIGFVKAVYSAEETQGTCACPENYQVAESTGACRGSAIVMCSSSGSDSNSNSSQQCSASCPSDGFGCFLGSHPITGGSCCSFELDELTQSASFDDIRVRSRSGCGSRTAQTIVEGLCMGKAGCSIDVDEDVTYSWAVGRDAGASCPEGSREVLGSDVNAARIGLRPETRRCQARLASKNQSDFSQCSSARRALIVYARCFATRIALANDWILALLGLDSISRRAFLGFAVVCDVVCSAVFFFVLRWLRGKERVAVARAAGSNQIKARDYTVQLHKLPPHRDLDELRNELEAHLESVLSSAPVVSVHFDKIRVANIQFGQCATSARLDVLRRRGDVVRSLEVVLQRIDKLQQLRSRAALATEAHALAKREQKHDRERVRLERRLGRLDERLDRLLVQQQRQESDQKLGINFCGHQSPAVTAYVTFEEEEGVLRCLHEYPELGVLHRLVQPAYKRLRGKRLRFRPAPDPSDVIWENLHYSYASRVLRQLGVAIVTLTVLLLSFTAIFLAELQKAKLERELGSPASCPVSVTKDDVSLDELHKSSGLAPYKALVECFCRQVLTHESFIAMTRETFTDLTASEDGQERYYCREWATTYATTRALAGVAVLTVVIVNMLLSRVLDALVGLEKHHTQSSRVVSRVTKVFLAQFCNTAVLMVALNANINYFLDQKSEASSASSTDSDSYTLASLLKLRVTAREVFRGKYSDFSPGWYTDVGVALLLTALANALSPHAWALRRYVVIRVSRLRDRGLRHWRDASRSSCATQRDLEALYRGPPFDLASRYAQALTSIFIVYLFSAGIPLMHLVGLIAMVTTYWADKSTFLRVARLPPALDGRVAAAAGVLLPYAVLLHCLVGLWMFSNARIFQSDEDVAEELSSFNTTTASDGIVHYDNEVGEGIPAFDATTSGQVWTRVTRPQVVVLFAFLAVFALVVLLRAALFHALPAAGRTLMPCLARVLGYSPPVRKARGLPNYFDAIPTEVLTEKLARAHVLLPHQALREKYERALDRRKEIDAGDESESPKRRQRRKQRAMSAAEHYSAANWIVGCPSYAISDNKEYVAALAIDSHLSEQLQLDQLL